MTITHVTQRELNLVADIDGYKRDIKLLKEAVSDLEKEREELKASNTKMFQFYQAAIDREHDLTEVREADRAAMRLALEALKPWENVDRQIPKVTAALSALRARLEEV